MEFVGGGIKVGVKCRIVIPDCAVQKVTGGLVKSIGVKTFVTQHIIWIVLIGSIAENGGNRELPVLLGKLLFEFCVILHCHRDGANCEDGVEAGHALAFQRVIATALSFLVKMIQDVLHNLLHPLRGAHRLFNVDSPDILVLDIVLLFYRIHIVNAEG